ncbi:MAG: hypothetical protein ACK4VU_11550 [Limnohabitans sp.]
MKSTLVAMFGVCVLAGCTAIPLENPPIYSNYKSKDTTLMAPDFQYQETPQSKSIIVGSQTYAITNSCQLIKRYRVVTNSDFTGSLNLMKYRASLMGAKWITIVSHRELDRNENAIQLNNDQIIYRDGIDIGSARYLSAIVADLYDCPCNINTCSSR